MAVPGLEAVNEPHSNGVLDLQAASLRRLRPQGASPATAGRHLAPQVQGGVTRCYVGGTAPSGVLTPE